MRRPEAFRSCSVELGEGLRQIGDAPCLNACDFEMFEDGIDCNLMIRDEFEIFEKERRVWLDSGRIEYLLSLEDFHHEVRDLEVGWKLI